MTPARRLRGRAGPRGHRRSSPSRCRSSGWSPARSSRSTSSTPSPPTLLPDPPSLANLAGVLGLLDVPRLFANSTFIAVRQRAATVLSSSVVGYAFATLPARGRGSAVRRSSSRRSSSRRRWRIVPQFILFSRLGWVGTYLPLIVPEPVRQRVLHLPVPAVVPEPAAAPVRERRARRREPAPGVPPHRAAAGTPGARGGRGLRLRRVVERLPRAAGLPALARHLHGRARHGDLPGRPRQRRPLLGRDGAASRWSRRSSSSSSPQRFLVRGVATGGWRAEVRPVSSRAARCRIPRPTLERRYGLMAESAAGSRRTTRAARRRRRVVRAVPGPDRRPRPRRGASGCSARPPTRRTAADGRTPAGGQVVIPRCDRPRHYLITGGAHDLAVVDVDAASRSGSSATGHGAATRPSSATRSSRRWRCRCSPRSRGYSCIHAAGVVRRRRGGRSRGRPAPASRRWRWPARGAASGSSPRTRSSSRVRPAGIELWGMPWIQRLLPDARTLFPELAGLTDRCRPNGEIEDRGRPRRGPSRVGPSRARRPGPSSSSSRGDRRADAESNRYLGADAEPLEVHWPWDGGWTAAHERGADLLGAQRRLPAPHERHAGRGGRCPRATGRWAGRAAPAGDPIGPPRPA